MVYYIWYGIYKILITASVFKSFVSEKTGDQITTIVKSHLWSDSNFDNEALRYGRENEEKAREEYAVAFEFEVAKTGLWVNSKYPGLGASPDAIVFDPQSGSSGLLEIKCPKILENLLPTDLEKLTSTQRQSFC